MEVRIQSIHFTADEKLLEFTEKKVEKLSQFHDQIMDADVFLKFDSASHAVKDKTADIKINIPGTTLFASETAKTFEESVDSAVESIRRQVRKRKSKEAN